MINSSRKLLIATRSKGKFPEIILELKDLPFRFINLNDVSKISKDYEVEESATTFEGNAIIKAIVYAKKSGCLTLAEDAGLEVDALGGRPGVYSVRYVAGSDMDRINKLLQELKDVPNKKRTARFRAVIAICDPLLDKVRVCYGVYEGKITKTPRGNNGFGYDPIFYNESLGKTNAEMTPEEKNEVSHRGKALKIAKKILVSEYI